MKIANRSIDKHITLPYLAQSGKNSTQTYTRSRSTYMCFIYVFYNHKASKQSATKARICYESATKCRMRFAVHKHRLRTLTIILHSKFIAKYVQIILQQFWKMCQLSETFLKGRDYGLLPSGSMATVQSVTIARSPRTHVLSVQPPYHHPIFKRLFFN